MQPGAKPVTTPSLDERNVALDSALGLDGEGVGRAPGWARRALLARRLAVEDDCSSATDADRDRVFYEQISLGDLKLIAGADLRGARRSALARRALKHYDRAWRRAETVHEQRLLLPLYDPTGRTWRDAIAAARAAVAATGIWIEALATAQRESEGAEEVPWEEEKPGSADLWRALDELDTQVLRACDALSLGVLIAAGVPLLADRSLAFVAIDAASRAAGPLQSTYAHLRLRGIADLRMWNGDRTVPATAWASLVRDITDLVDDVESAVVGLQVRPGRRQRLVTVPWDRWPEVVADWRSWLALKEIRGRWSAQAWEIRQIASAFSYEVPAEAVPVQESGPTS